jgi:hypothetical protein
MRYVCYGITVLATVVAGFQLFNTFVSAESAPQQAAGAAMASAIAIIPYVFSRCWEKLLDKNEEQNDTIIEALKAIFKQNGGVIEDR